MEPQATDQRRPLPLFTILTLNTNTRADLAGLPTLLSENRPDFVFIQEVNISLERLRAALCGGERPGLLSVAVLSRSAKTSHCSTVTPPGGHSFKSHSRVPAKSDF